MEINLIAPINQLSYGIVSYNILKELQKECSVSLFPLNLDLQQNQIPIVKQALDNAKFFNDKTPCLRIWHAHDMSMRVGSGKFFGMSIFEVNGFTDLEKHHLSSLDEIFVCSEWAKSIVDQNLNIPCHVVPLGVDTEIFKPQFIRKRKKYTFLNVGKAEKRKGHDLLIKAFNDAFTEQDDVELWLCWDNKFPNCQQDKWKSLVSNSKLSKKIKELPRQNTQYDLAYIMQQADCGIFPSRAEGWNLPLLEMMACGKPVIATNYSAHTQYCTKENSYLIDCGLEPAKDDEWPQFNGEFQWAKPDYDQLIEHMRFVYNNEISENTPGLITANEYTWKNTILQLKTYIH